MADPIAYPLVLGGIYAGVCALERPTRRAQLAFVGLSGLAAFARLQYVVLPAAFVVAAFVLERRRALRVHRLPLALLALPVAAALAIGPSRVLGYYSGIAHLKVGAGSILHWASVDAMLLAYSSGWILVPGALVALVLALARPLGRAERAFAVLLVVYAAGLFAEAALYASSGSTRFQERYLFTLLPLVGPTFGLYVARGWPRRLVVGTIAAGMVVLSARIPLSGFSAADNKQDSPFLFAVFRLEGILGVGSGAFAVALAAAALSGAAVLVARRRWGGGVALGLAVVAAGAASVGAFALDAQNARDEPRAVALTRHAADGGARVGPLLRRLARANGLGDGVACGRRRGARHAVAHAEPPDRDGADAAPLPRAGRRPARVGSSRRPA